MALEATPIIQPSDTDVECADLDLIQEQVEFQDDCPIMPKLNAFLTARGQHATLEKIFRNRKGEPVNLTSCGCVPVSESASESIEDLFCGVKVRIMEILGIDSNEPVREVEGEITDPSNGKMRVVLPLEVLNFPAIYRLEWGIFVDGLVVATCQSYLFVEAGLFGFNLPSDATLETRQFGPPTILEIRMSIRDNMGENVLLEGDVEFSDAEIVFAITRPIREFDERPPPLSTRYTTRKFKWKEYWLKGIQANLYHMAAMWYQRNRLQVTTGGLTIDDLNKQREYLVASQLVRKEWNDWVIHKKVELNARDFVSTTGSTYGGYGGL